VFFLVPKHDETDFCPSQNKELNTFPASARDISTLNFRH